MKSALIHPTALIDDTAVIGKGVRIGPYSIIGPEVYLGEGCRIGAHVLIERNTRIGDRARICKGAAIGVDPVDAKYQGQETWLEIGHDAVLRENCVIARGSTDTTLIGNRFVLMTQGHVSHDCAIGSNVIVSNGVNLLDHAVVEDDVIIGGLTFVNRFCRIGTLSFVGGGFRVAKDVPPFIIAGDEPLQITGINTVALKKHDYSDAQIENIAKIYKILHAAKGDAEKAMKKTDGEIASTEETERILEFVQQSERGII